MATTLLAPEFIITWAARQFLIARRAANRFNDTFCAQLPQAQADHQNIGDGSTATLLSEMAISERNSPIPDPPRVAGHKFRDDYAAWTVMHGFFACMGGFLLYVNGEPRAPLEPNELWDFVRNGSVDMPTIAEEDIEDRSKGDILSKGIAILQLVWFVISLAARYAQNLPITLLEIDTLAIAALTCIVYFLWWKKPKDVGRPFLVHWKKMEPPPPSDLVYGQANLKLIIGDSIGYFIYPVLRLLGTVFIFSVVSPHAAHSRRVLSLGGYNFATDGDDTAALLTGCFIVSITISKISLVKTLFIPDVPGTNIPPAPDGQPPLAFIIDAAAFLGAANCPVEPIIFGSVLASISIPHGIWTSLPLGSIGALAVSKQLIIPALGIFICSGLLG
ncbi:hypothetical protein AZE42_04273 [Rhizopogon vesiculosus]|uniref:Uncharacterized protein n=1 Tax=Rhizopogon vesiculosus TaxID=180088 RepID=A0A1J8QBL8_9AGAM|nr:hypothetical protein AZE42_04273 [Rhizopogon vesiculosus]